MADRKGRAAEPTPVTDDANASAAQLQQRAADDYEAQNANASDRNHRDDAGTNGSAR